VPTAERSDDMDSGHGDSDNFEVKLDMHQCSALSPNVAVCDGDGAISREFRDTLHCLQCFDTVGWASGRASGL